MNVNRIVLTSLLSLTLAASAAPAQLLRGAEMRVNTKTEAAQWLSDVGTAADGSFVVVWQEGGETATPSGPVYVKARLFDAAGHPRSGEIQVGRHAQVPYVSFEGPAVAMAPDGRFVVAWTGGTTITDVVYGRRYAANGAPLGGRIRLAVTPRGQSEPDVAMAADGSFVAAWSQRGPKEDPDDPDEVAIDVYVRRFGADGRPLGPETLAVGGHEEQSRPRLALRPNGSFVIACNIYRGESNFYDVVAQRFASTGEPAGELIEVAAEFAPDTSQVDPSIVAAADGRFAIAWTDRYIDYARGGTNLSADDPTGVAVRVFSPDGTVLGPARPVNLHITGFQAEPAIAALANGGFVVLWTSSDAQDGDGFGIFGRVVSADGTPRGREFRVNTNRTGNQRSPALSIAPNGKGAATWTGLDGDRTGVFARLLGQPRQGS
jgi:hypothetical protein